MLGLRRLAKGIETATLLQGKTTNLYQGYLLFILALLFYSPSAFAFSSWQQHGDALEMRGLLRGSAVALKNPDNKFFYQKRSIVALAGSGRLMVNGKYGDLLSFEMHVEQRYIPLLLQSGGRNLATQQGVERTNLLEWRFDNRRAQLLIDRLNVQYSASKLNIKLGRQPLNLAATFYFTPNDFFAPFAAQSFYRSYKPGVDAVRADIQLAELSQLSLISVLGYRADGLRENGWSSHIDTTRNTYLAHASTVVADFDLALLLGSVKKKLVIGGDFQGELFEWLGVRGEGHLAIPKQLVARRSVEFSLGLEHRWENSLTLRAEQFYHGGGSATLASYSLQSESTYMARNYSAIGASYEFTPLVSADMTSLYNWLDHSSLISIYGLYSLSNESELAFSVVKANGKRPQSSQISSEFGLYGDSLTCELRSYF
ncbi:MAG: hypothetical protein Q9M31_01660 [Mariprofundus sp.]|nr:hypothetical protein [Mariprofundus sp.]